MAKHIFDDIAAGITDAIVNAPKCPLAALDQTTVRALCDAGYITHRAYVDLARSAGWQLTPALIERERRNDDRRGPPEGDSRDLYIHLR